MNHSLTISLQTRRVKLGPAQPRAACLGKADDSLNAAVAGSMVSSVFFSLLSQRKANHSSNKYVRLRF